MKIGIDISQMVYEGTGVGEYVEKLVDALISLGSDHKFILLLVGASQEAQRLKFKLQSKLKDHNSNVNIKTIRVPIAWIEFVWNRLHILPIEWLIGDVDVFFTSDWVEPPTIRAKKITTIHDLSVLKVPETFDRKIVSVHTRKLRWVAKESAKILCDSIATKSDVMQLLHVPEHRLEVVYPGLS